MYSVTSWLGRIGFDDNPTTAIVLHFLKISATGSALPCGTKLELSGTNTLIAPSTQAFLCAAPSRAPAPQTTCHSLPSSPPKSESPPETPSTPAAARSPLRATIRH